jgi:hypothetical protein
MTETKNHIPGRHPDKAHIEFDEKQQPRITFDKLCQQAVSIERRINSGEWQMLARNVRSPFTDGESFSRGGELAYRLRYGSAQEENIVLRVYLPS